MFICTHFQTRKLQIKMFSIRVVLIMFFTNKLFENMFHKNQQSFVFHILNTGHKLRVLVLIHVKISQIWRIADWNDHNTMFFTMLGSIGRTKTPVGVCLSMHIPSHMRSFKPIFINLAYFSIVLLRKIWQKCMFCQTG